MMMRDWRQGDLLTPKSAGELPALAGCTSEQRRAVVITHDCDLARDESKEPTVEVIVGDVVDVAKAELRYAKNPRQLHLAYKDTNGRDVFVELRHTERRVISKKEFTSAHKDCCLSLEDKEKRTLKQWLAARYGRAAFPDSFVARFEKFEDKLKKITERVDKYLVAVYFDLDKNKTKELPDGEPYDLSIFLIFSENDEMGQPLAQAREMAEQAAIELRDRFEGVFGKPEDATKIALDRCAAVADTNFTLGDIRRMLHWRLEHLSLRDEVSGDFVPVGETPP